MNLSRNTIAQANNAGFTLVEILLSMGIIGILLGFATINLLKAQHNASVAGAVDTLIADLKSQQIKAMSGTSVSGSGGGNFGAILQSNQYTLFSGTFTSGLAANFTVTPDSITFTSTFPKDSYGYLEVLFSQQTGEIVNFSLGKNTITIQNSAGSEAEIITLNRFGVVTKIQSL